MVLRAKKLLEDMRMAFEAIQEYTGGKTLDDYRGSRLLRDGVERQLLIIGEAVSQLAKTDPSTASRLGNYRQIISFRNLLVHGYSVVDDRVTWEIVQQDLPDLGRRVVDLLNE